MKVLFLTPWYPSEKDAMVGLFVQKHVEAVRAQGVDVRVIHSQRLLDTWHQWGILKREGWIPDIVQLNVIQKQGLLALSLWENKHIPYIIVEHWSGYMPENGQFMRMSSLKRSLYRFIAKEAAMILTVSDCHAQAMQSCGIRNDHWGRINNVVDDFFCRRKAKSQDSKIKTLLHVSCFDERAKNIKGLLRAARRLSEKRQDWQLVLVGNGVDYQEVRDYADTLHFPAGMIRWTGELSPKEVSDEFDKSDAFVLSSNYENAPVVISESLAKGIPVVSTNVGGISEMVDHQCGILVSPGNDEKLTEALNMMLDHYPDYDAQTIRQHGEQYSFGIVGAKLKAIYDSCVQATQTKQAE